MFTLAKKIQNLRATTITFHHRHQSDYNRQTDNRHFLTHCSSFSNCSSFRLSVRSLLNWSIISSMAGYKCPVKTMVGYSKVTKRKQTWLCYRNYALDFLRTNVESITAWVPCRPKIPIAANYQAKVNNRCLICRCHIHTGMWQEIASTEFSRRSYVV